jgi:hypothetical protein
MCFGVIRADTPAWGPPRTNRSARVDDAEGLHALDWLDSGMRKARWPCGLGAIGRLRIAGVDPTGFARRKFLLESGALLSVALGVLSTSTRFRSGFKGKPQNEQSHAQSASSWDTHLENVSAPCHPSLPSV